MTTYQSTVEAQRFDLARADELAKWCGGRKISSSEGFWILIGQDTAVPGDYIVKEQHGSFMVASEEEFLKLYHVVGGTEDREYVLARLLANAEVIVPEITLPGSAFADGYYVELGEHRFNQAQWEAIQLYASGVANIAVQEYDENVTELLPKGHKAQRQNAAFHEAMGIPTAASPQAIPAEDVPVVIELIREEFVDELIPALGVSGYWSEGGDFVITGYHTPNVMEIYDALLDILYVTYGALNRAGMDAESGYDEVQGSNLSKLGEDGKAIIAGDNDPDGIFPGRVKKGPNYYKPNLTLVLTEQGWQG